MSDYYELLEVPRNADEDTIKKSYRRLARQFHPDSNKARIASEHMKLLNAAYDVLSDPSKRREYDERLSATARRAAPPPPKPHTRTAPSPQPKAQPRAAAPSPPPPARPRSTTPAWMLWMSVTGVLIVATAVGTLFIMRDSVMALLPQVAASSTRIAGALSAQSSASTTAPPINTLVPSTPTLGSAKNLPSPVQSKAPTIVPTVSAYPVPARAITGTKYTFAEFLNGNGPSDIFVTNANGTLKANVTNTTDRSEVSPSWSPLGTRIVFSEFASGNLYVVNSDGSLPTRITTDTELYDSNPVWAPFGSLIATVSIPRAEYDKGNTQAAKIYVVDFSSRVRRLIADQPGRDLTWSLDAKWIAFQVPSGNGTTIYIVPADRSSTTPFFFNVSQVRRMAWTVDSKQLLYEAYARDTNHDGVVDERDQTEMFVISLQPLAVNPLTKSVTVSSPRGRFPGSPTNGEFYPPVTTTVQPQ